MSQILSQQNENEVELEITLRPQNFNDYIGQTKAKQSIDILTSAAKLRGEPLDHILIYGPPGLGKTTMAYIIANQMASNIKVTSGPAIERTGDLASILSNLQDNDILFIDEIHRLNKVVEEVLYPAMEDYALDLVIGKGPAAKTLRIDLPKFTVIGATTRMGLISSPLRDRFGLVQRLEYYDTEDVEKIIKRSAQILKVEIDSGGSREIAKRSRCTPRIANRLLKRVRDFAQVKNQKIINQELASNALDILDIDTCGLDNLDRKILTNIIEKFSGGPVGLQTLAASVSEDIDSISEVYEPYLMQIGFIERTPRGRKATKLAYSHMGLSSGGQI